MKSKCQQYNSQNKRPALLNIGRRKKRNYICCDKPVCFIPVELTVDPEALHQDYSEPYGCDLKWILDDGCDSLISTTTGYTFYSNNKIQEVNIVSFGGKIPNPPTISSDKMSFSIVMPEAVGTPLNDYCLINELLFIDGSIFEIQLKVCDTWHYFKVGVRQC